MYRIEDLNVFKLSFDLAEAIYKITSIFPKDETYGLVSQMRRAVVSIGSNLSEGGSRTTDGEQKQFFGIARGSAAELKFQVMLSKRLGFIDNLKYDELLNNLDNIHKMITGLIKKRI